MLNIIRHAAELRSAWLALHPGQNRVPIGITFNPYHAAMDVYEADIRRLAAEGKTNDEIKEFLLPKLMKFYDAIPRGMINRIHCGNLDVSDLKLPLPLQRSLAVSSEGLLPEMEILRKASEDNPALTTVLESSPQSALSIAQENILNSGQTAKPGWRGAFLDGLIALMFGGMWSGTKITFLIAKWTFGKSKAPRNQAKGNGSTGGDISRGFSDAEKAELLQNAADVDAAASRQCKNY